MSQLSDIVAGVQGVAVCLDKMAQYSVAVQRDLAQKTSFILDQTKGSSQTDIKDCLVAIRSAISSLQQMQAALGQAVAVANTWIEKNSDGGSNAPFSSHSMTFGSGDEYEEENTHSHRR